MSIEEMKPTRRNLLFAATGMAIFQGFKMPGKKNVPEGKCVFWGVVQAGGCIGPNVFQQFKDAKSEAKKFGFEVLDSIHKVDCMSEFLVSRTMSIEQARKAEEDLICESTGLLTESDLHFKATWIEIA